MGQSPKLDEALGSNPTLSVAILGYETELNDVIGGIAQTKWLTTLTGESPTSSTSAIGCSGKA